MICVPMIFWFGAGSTGRGSVPLSFRFASCNSVPRCYRADEISPRLLYVLAGGGYITSVLKDLFCVPRPFAPPMFRLGVSNHAQEYGFPSTHSTNSVSMALYFGELFYRSGWGEDFLLLQAFVYGMLAFFAGSVTFGRLYCGMVSSRNGTPSSSKSNILTPVALDDGRLCWIFNWSLRVVRLLYS